MKYRIAIWAGVGLLVAGFWAVYFFPIAPIPMTPSDLRWTLVYISVPVVAAGSYFHFPLGVYWSLLVNAGSYALIGLIAETVRQQPNHAK
jgi:hypothetical protein